MNQNNMPHSGRQPHFRKIRREVIRRAWQRGWKQRGYAAYKTISGRKILMTVPKDLGEYYLCRFQLEHDSQFEERGSFGGMPIPYFMMPTVHHFIDDPSKRAVAKRRTRKPLDKPKQSAKELYVGRPYQP